MTELDKVEPGTLILISLKDALLGSRRLLDYMRPWRHWRNFLYDKSLKTFFYLIRSEVDLIIRFKNFNPPKCIRSLYRGSIDCLNFSSQCSAPNSPDHFIVLKVFSTELRSLKLQMHHIKVTFCICNQNPKSFFQRSPKRVLNAVILTSCLLGLKH